MSNVRVRFAPSPTGFFHIGGARTALFNWLYARHTKGTFVLRIEDTDKERDRPEFLQVILDGLRWLGMDWDEGPEKGGNFGPYFQSQRGHIYEEYITKLKESGRAYEKEGALWLKISGEGQVINDAIRGRVERKEEEDFVIVRSNGTPVFHLVNVIDDLTMQITHVIRGEDHLSNTSKHMELFRAFEATPPIYAHIPLILKSDGPGKMSKRDRGALIEEYQQRHFLPEAVRNFLCLLGWSPKEDREILPIEEVISLFDIANVNKNNAHFDEKKMAFINCEYVKHLPLDSFVDKVKPILLSSKVIDENTDKDYIKDVLSICQEKVRGLEDVPHFVGYFFTENYPFDEKAKEKVMKKGNVNERLEEFLAFIEPLNALVESELEPGIKKLAESKNVNTGDYIHAVRLAVSGTNVGPGIYGLIRVLGKTRVQQRIKKFIA
ncbi:MAG: glutamate--tRNA ligase [Verrucomicrobia bacterium GWC2_42_7]|nr:MAG: glutamate--tRNA ligase [Verrucomicrobia bacterium GWC2_42_7]